MQKAKSQVLISFHLFRSVFYHLIVCVCVCIGICTCECSAIRGLKRALDPLQLDLELYVSCQMCWEWNLSPLQPLGYQHWFHYSSCSIIISRLSKLSKMGRWLLKFSDFHIRFHFQVNVVKCSFYLHLMMYHVPVLLNATFFYSCFRLRPYGLQLI